MSKPTPGALHRVPTSDLISELQRRMNCRADVLAGDVEPCLILAVTPSDLSEFWECDEQRRSRVPEANEWHAIRHAFDRWQDCGSFSDLMETLRDAWKAEQARQLDQEGGSK